MKFNSVCIQDYAYGKDTYYENVNDAAVHIYPSEGICIDLDVCKIFKITEDSILFTCMIPINTNVYHAGYVTLGVDHEI